MNSPEASQKPLPKLLGSTLLARLAAPPSDSATLPGFSFWRINLVFWCGFAFLTFFGRIILQIPPAQAVVLTIFNEGIAFLLAVLLRELYLKNEIVFRLRTAARMVAISMVGAFVLAIFSYLFSALLDWHVPGMSDRESACLRFILLWTALLGWSLGYFWIQAQRAWTIETIHAREAIHDAHRMELQMLRAQLDPHFLFNSLNSIAAEIRPRPDTATDMVCQLSEYLRYSLDHRKNVFSPLSAEIGAMRAYLEIERARFGDRLTFSVEATPQALAAIVPSFLLQPLVENALKHNLLERRHMDLAIRTTCENGHLHIEVENTGVIVAHSPSEHGGLGLDTLRRRLDLHYPGRHTFSLAQRGFLVYATLDLLGTPCSA